jgi:hypothetical protein
MANCHPLCACKCDQIACGCHITFKNERVLPPVSPPDKEKRKR